MKITSKQLKNWSACKNGFEFFVKKCGKSVTLKKFIDVFTTEKQFDWAWWVLKKVLTKKQSVTIAIYAAEKVIDIFEKKYPEDKRPRNAIEAARAWLKNPTEINRQAADDAADDAAYAYVNTAYAAGNATYVNAAYAAYAAAAADANDAAANAANAADEVAYANADDTAYIRVNLKTEILKYAVDVIEKKEAL